MNFEDTKRFVLLSIFIAIFCMPSLNYADSANDKTSIEDVKKEARDFTQALKAYTADQRDEAIKKAKAALDDLDKRIDALELRIDNSWDKMDKAARENARASLTALRKRRSQVAKWYGSLKSSSTEAWGHMKKGFSDAYDSLYDAWEKSEKEFGSDK